jgi:DNA-binding beta-propeller fold protein YncE
MKLALLLLITVALRGQELLTLEATIPLPGVQGRIDHLAIDVKGQRLFIAALGNDTLEVIDLKMRKRIHTVRGLAEPQGIAYMPSLNRVFVANGKDGSVRIFDAGSWSLLKSVDYGDDADNLRIDPASGRIWAGYGSGALGEFEIDGKKDSDIRLDAHPESFQIERNGTRIFVNLPHSKKIAIVDRAKNSVVANWTTGGAQANYPMALDEQNRRLFIVARSPATLVVLDTNDGRRAATLPAIGDCDDVFHDAQRRRLYAIGGEGGISVFEQRTPDQYTELGRVVTVKGARTGLFSPDLDRLYVAVRATASQPAAIRIYAPPTIRSGGR